MMQSELENWSRDARYTSPPTAFNEEIASLEVERAQRINDHIKHFLSEG